MKPYVGIAGVTSRRESGAVAAQFMQNGFSRTGTVEGAIGYCLTAGMMCGSQSLKPRYIQPQSLADVMNPDQSFGRNVVHYSPFAESEEWFLADIGRIFHDTGIYESGVCRTLQVNNAFLVDPAALEKLKEVMPDMHIILQVGPRELSIFNARDIVDWVQDSAASIDRILLDPSLGRGVSISPASLTDYIHGLEVTFPGKGLVFAGGFGPGNVGKRMQELERATARMFSIDAETGLRDPQDCLDLSRTQEFIKQAAATLPALRQQYARRGVSNGGFGDYTP